MNAYKLAEELQGFGYLENDLHFCPFQAQVDMLIHQADRIKELETKYQKEFEYAEKLLKEQQR